MTAAQEFDFGHRLLHEQVADKLRGMIIEGELQPDTSVDELALCARFNISRTPLREALKVLAAEELVILRPRRGAVVSKLTSASVAQKFEVVGLIEGHAVRCLCERRDEDAVLELAAIHARVGAAFRAQSRKRYFEANQAFHRRLVELTGNDEFVRIHGHLLGHLQRVRYFTGQQKNWRHSFMTEHDEIMALITAGRAAEAEDALRRHIAHVARTVVDVVG